MDASGLNRRLAALHELSKCPVETVPPGWFTRQEFQDQMRLSASVANKSLTAAVRAGKAEVRRFRITAGMRGTYSTPHYKLTR